MKIYISGKITGDRRYKAKFREVEKKLAAAGHIVLNPAREWVDNIVAFCEENEIPVFFKDNLRKYFPDLPASAFPWEV